MTDDGSNLESRELELVGILGNVVYATLREWSIAKEVYAVRETWQHIEEKHGLQFDLPRAWSLLPVVFYAPLCVWETTKPRSFRFAGDYDDKHKLIVTIKALENELWLETMFTRNNWRYQVGLQKAKIIYRR